MPRNCQECRSSSNCPMLLSQHNMWARNKLVAGFLASLGVHIGGMSGRFSKM